MPSFLLRKEEMLRVFKCACANITWHQAVKYNFVSLRVFVALSVIKTYFQIGLGLEDEPFAVLSAWWASYLCLPAFVE